MTITTTRVAPGQYLALVNDRTVAVLLDADTKTWRAVDSATGRKLADGNSKKSLLSRLEILARSTRDRTKSDSHKIPRRSELTKGTELSLVPRSVPGVRGRVKFLGYTRTNSNVEWLDVVDSNGRSRAIDPAKVKTVHRDRKML